jgi:hypothetical protein
MAIPSQFFRFVLTLTLGALFYIALAIVLVEFWLSLTHEAFEAKGKFVINILALACGASLAYWLQCRWVFGRGTKLKKWGHYLALMLSLWVLHELLLVSIVLRWLPLSYPTILILALCVSLGLAFMACKKYIFFDPS